MKPVDQSGLNGLLQRKPILMLDTIGLTINFIDTIVRQSPSLITTKKGKKTLPLELWLEILEWAREWTLHLLVQPQRLEEGSTNTLICAEIPGWEACGQLEDNKAIEVYEYYLSQPGDGPDDGRPFLLPQTVDKTYKVPITALNQNDWTLCSDLTVPDVISWVEDGECSLCEGGMREFCAGCRDGQEVKDMFFDGMGVWADCGMNMPCPLCMGLDYSLENMFQQNSDNEYEPGYLTREEYSTWVASRWRELGYKPGCY